MQVFTLSMFCIGKYKVQEHWLEMGKIPIQLTLEGCPQTSQVTLQLQRGGTSLQVSWKVSKLPPQDGIHQGRCQELAGSLGKESEEGTQTWAWHMWEDTLTRGTRKTPVASSMNARKDLAGDVSANTHTWFPSASSPAPLTDSCHCALCSGCPAETHSVMFCCQCFHLNGQSSEWSFPASRHPVLGYRGRWGTQP